jgi:energy-coupling factor transporter ATP-binding protein EcfA2
MKHSKYPYIKTLVSAGETVLLLGSAGTGKTTIAMQLAEDLSLPFYTMSMTKQTAVSALIGFISINGTYIPSQLRTAFETGGIFLLDELDAADVNVLLTLNTIENGFLAFPDKIVRAHPDFHLIATANPINEHSSYTGRSKLDFSTTDRYHKVELARDDSLEIHLTSQSLFEEVTLARQLMSEMGLTATVTMRDSLRMHRLQSLGIAECVFKDVVFDHHPDLYSDFTSKRTAKVVEQKKASRTQSECITIDELWETVSSQPAVGVDYTKGEAPVPEEYYLARQEAFDAVQNYMSNKRPSSRWAISKNPTAEDPYALNYTATDGKYRLTFPESEFIPF